MFSFSSQNRLINRNDFQSVFRSHNKVSVNSFYVVYKKNELSFARLGILIRKVLVNRAVDRNNLKRFIRESFRQSNIKNKNLDIIILLKTKDPIHDKRQLKLEINELWNRLVNFSK